MQQELFLCSAIKILPVCSSNSGSFGQVSVKVCLEMISSFNISPILNMAFADISADEISLNVPNFH